jgi:hypothetical protein
MGIFNGLCKKAVIRRMKAVRPSKAEGFYYEADIVHFNLYEIIDLVKSIHQDRIDYELGKKKPQGKQGSSKITAKWLDVFYRIRDEQIKYGHKIPETSDTWVANCSDKMHKYRSPKIDNKTRREFRQREFVKKWNKVILSKG